MIQDIIYILNNLNIPHYDLAVDYNLYLVPWQSGPEDKPAHPETGECLLQYYHGVWCAEQNKSLAHILAFIKEIQPIYQERRRELHNVK